MAELKTKPTTQSVSAFLNAIEDDQIRKDCKQISKIMADATGAKPVMWGPSIVGFGKYRYKYASGREGDWMMTGFSPRKQNLTVYIMPGFDKYDALMKKLGKFKAGKSCLYFKSLEDVDLAVLEELVKSSVNYLKKKYRG